MEPRRTLIIHLDLHWRAVVAAACLVAVLALALSVTSAQGEGAPGINDREMQAAGVSAEVPAAATPDQAASDCGELLPAVNGECVGPEPVGTGSVSRSPALAGRVTAAGHGVRHVYVTEHYVYPDEAAAACGPGYHMASLWEIADTSNWVYEADHPAAHVQDDSGHGPPSSFYGWIRTGYWASGDPAPGTGNCLAWTSRSSGSAGTLVRLTRYWEDPMDILTWDAYSISCDSIAPVWCVRD